MAKLINNRVKAEYYIAVDPATMGRHPSNDIVLTGSSISRFHAKIGTVDGEYYIQDLGSTYGTYLNGERVDCRSDVLVSLKDGNRVQLAVSSAYPSGEYDLTFSEDEVPAEAAAAIRQIVAERGVVHPGQIAYKAEGGTLIVKLSGAFRAPECDALVNDLLSKARSEPRDFVIDLHDVGYMNSYALGSFAEIWVNLHALGCKIILSSATGEVLDLLEMAGVVARLGSYPSVSEALHALEDRS